MSEPSKVDSLTHGTARWHPKYLIYLEKYSFSILLLQILRAFFFLLDCILGPLVDYTLAGGHTTELLRAGKDYKKSAQLVQILYRGTYSFMHNHQLDNFLYRHLRYVNPRFILENDNVTLHGITPTHAFFCVTTDPNKNVIDTAISPFMNVHQFQQADQLVILPLSTLHLLAEELGDPDDRRVTVLDGTGRCGSTLLCQMMARVPNVRTFSEPFAPLHAHGHYHKGHFSLPKLEKIIQSCMRLLCKPENTKKISHIIIKMDKMCIQLQPVIKKLFPNWRFVFQTRNCRDTFYSWQKLTLSLPSYFMNTPLWVTYYSDHMSFPYSMDWNEMRKKFQFETKPEMLAKVFAYCYAGAMICFLENKSNYCLSMLYEDLLADPRGQTKRLFAAFGIGEEHVDTALEAMRHDAQQGIYGGRGNEGIEVDQEQWKEIDDVLRRFGVNRLSTEMSVEDLRRVVC